MSDEIKTPDYNELHRLMNEMTPKEIVRVYEDVAGQIDLDRYTYTGLVPLAIAPTEEQLDRAIKRVKSNAKNEG